MRERRAVGGRLYRYALRLSAIRCRQDSMMGRIEVVLPVAVG